MKSFKKYFNLMFILALAVVMTTACGEKPAGDGGTPTGDTGSDISAKEKIVIGGSGPLTGDAASYGTSVKQGAEIAVKEINAAGGVLGKNLELVFLDDEATEEGAIAAYSQLKDSKADMILGTVTSGACLATTDLTKKDNILQLTPSGSAKEITKYENVFRVCFTDPLQGEQMANFATEKGYTKAATIYMLGDEYSTGMMEAFVAKFEENGGEVVTSESFQDGAIDFSSQLTSIRNSNPDVIFIPAYYQYVAKILDQAMKQGVEVPFIGGDGWDGVLGLDSVPANIEGCIFLSPFIADDVAENVKNFVASYNEAYGKVPDQFAADGYDGVYILKAAVEKANSLDTKALIKAMTEISVDGVTGKMSFTADGEPDKDAKFIEIKDGKYQAYTK